jgi:hypothetical protein
MHKNVGERLKAGPVWDFDQSVDNNRPYMFEPDAAAMQGAGWFKQFVRDGLFSRRVASRYRALRQGYLSDEYVDAFIDNAAASLGDAVKRDWNRWQYASGRIPNPALASNARSFEEETAHVKSVLRRHAEWLDEHLRDVVMGNVIVN